MYSYFLFTFWVVCYLFVIPDFCVYSKVCHVNQIKAQAWSTHVTMYTNIVTWKSTLYYFLLFLLIIK